MIKPGELYLADLYEAGVRPILIISRESLNRGGYAVAVPLTSAHFDRRSRLPNCVPFRAGQFGLTKDCVAQCEAVLTVERSQIEESGGPSAHWTTTQCELWSARSGMSSRPSASWIEIASLRPVDFGSCRMQIKPRKF